MDAILGRDDRLVAKLVDAAVKVEAGFAAIIGTPVPAVIGTDHQALRRMCEKKTDLPVLAVIPKKDGNEDRKKGQGKLKKSRSTGRGAKAPEKGAGTRQKSGADRKGRGEN